MTKRCLLLIFIFCNIHAYTMNISNQNIISNENVLFPEHFDQKNYQKPGSLYAKYKQLKEEKALFEIHLSDLQKDRDWWKKWAIRGWAVAGIAIVCFMFAAVIEHQNPYEGGE
ncbi:MAG TPA: hypothetical protein VGW78_02255 [Candidatus Babeliales bacterium]|nr:hypothetical protein [Candidatus Babeliales bacterium]